MAFPLYDSAKLRTGYKMPIMGLGTWQSPNEEVKRAVNAALEMGYRHIDTAFMYSNEAAIGEVLKEWLDSGRIKREELFVTTKLPMIAMRASDVEEYVGKSLRNLQLSYLDCYLIHGPIGVNNPGDDSILIPIKDGKVDIDPTTDLVAIWNALEDEVDAGRIRTIGVSNFSIEQMRRVNTGAKKHKIAVQQIELHAQFQQKPQRDYCSKHGIVIMAYAPLGSPGRMAGMGTAKAPNLLEDPRVKEIAWNHRVTPAQILLHHLAQKGLVVIPKSVTPARIQVNFQIFNIRLSPREYSILDDMDLGAQGRSFVGAGFPGIDEHPEFNPEMQ